MSHPLLRWVGVFWIEDIGSSRDGIPWLTAIWKGRFPALMTGAIGFRLLALSARMEHWQAIIAVVVVLFWVYPRWLEPAWRHWQLEQSQYAAQHWFNTPEIRFYPQRATGLSWLNRAALAAGTLQFLVPPEWGLGTAMMLSVLSGLAAVAFIRTLWNAYWRRRGKLENVLEHHAQGIRDSTIRYMQTAVLQRQKGWGKVRVEGLEVLDRMNTFYAFKHKLTQVIASREVIVAAVSDIHGISIDARAPVTLMVDGLEDAPSSWKRFLRTTVRVGENHYPLGFAVGYFDPGEILGRAILGSPHAHQLGPRIGPFVDDDILAVELVRGKTIGQLMDGGHWEQAYSAQLRAAFELENLGLRAWDWTTWGNIIVEEGTERARIIDHRDVGFQENPPMPSLMPFKIMTNWFLSCVDMSLEPFNADLIQRFESRAQWMAEELADMAVREWGGKSVSCLLASGEIDHVLSHWNQETNPRRPLRDAAVAALRNAFADAARRAA